MIYYLSANSFSMSYMEQGEPHPHLFAAGGIYPITSVWHLNSKKFENSVKALLLSVYYKQCFCCCVVFNNCHEYLSICDVMPCHVFLPSSDQTLFGLVIFVLF